MLNFLMDVILFFPRLIFKSIAYMISFVAAIVILLFALGYCTKSALTGKPSVERQVIEHQTEHKDQNNSQ